MKNDSLNKTTYYFLLTILPIISLALVILLTYMKEEIKRSFEFSIITHYYIPLIIFGIIVISYLILIYYCRDYNHTKYLKIITTLYLLVFIIVEIANANLLLGINLFTYKYLDLCIVFNIAVYLFLRTSSRLEN